MSGNGGKQLRNVRLGDQVAEALLERIRDDDLEPGHRLPTERELCEEYGVSRTTVREATRFLLARGVVEVRAGSGLVVAAVDPDSATQNLALFLLDRVGDDYRAVHELREVIEAQTARRAAERGTAGQLRDLKGRHEEMGEAVESGDVERMSAADIEFHRSLGVASGNEIFVVLLDSVAPALITPRQTNLVHADARREALDAHGEILDAVMAKDADAAATAMRGHLDYVLARWGETVDPEQ